MACLKNLETICSLNNVSPLRSIWKNLTQNLLLPNDPSSWELIINSLSLVCFTEQEFLSSSLPWLASYNFMKSGRKETGTSTMASLSLFPSSLLLQGDLSGCFSWLSSLSIFLLLISPLYGCILVLY